MKRFSLFSFRRCILAALVLMLALPWAALAEEGEGETLKLDVVRVGPASITVDSGANFARQFTVENNNSPGVDADRTFDGTATVTTTGGIVCTPTSVSFSGLAKGSPLTINLNCTAPTGPASKETITVSASGTPSPKTEGGVCGVGGNKCSDDGTPNKLTVNVSAPPSGDTTPPVIVPTVSPAPNANGWNNTNVTVSWNVSDPESGIASSSGCGTTTLTTETVGTTLTCSATNGAGLSNSASVTVKIDKTKPVITGSPTPPANVHGWNNTDVEVSFSCADTGTVQSGIDTNTVAGATLTSEGENQEVTNTGSCTDMAGNIADSATVGGINIDKTKPVITGSRDPLANAYGWNNTNVTVSFSCADTGSVQSGIDIDTVAGDVVSTEGENQEVTNTGTCTDKAGNTANSATVSGINIDKTPPTISASATANGSPYTPGTWTNKDVTVSFTCSDALSGVDVEPVSPQVVSTEGAGQSRSATCTDNAGNSASLTFSGINIDKTPPTISASATANGSPYTPGTWTNNDVTVSFDCDDDLSGVDICEPDHILTTEDANQSATGTATDNAGNSASVTLSGINIDKTPPEVTIATPADGAVYLLNQTVVADWSATDALSGIAFESGTVPSGAPIDTGSVGTKYFTVTATDNAGNATTVTYTYYVGYAYGGILQPINADGNSIFKLGSTVPVKFQLRDANGAFVTNAVARIYVLKVSNGVTGTGLEAVSTSAATTGNLFRYDATSNQYIFNLATKPLSAGTWQIRIELNDGSSQYVQISLR